MNAPALEARHLGDPQARLESAHAHLGLDREAIRVRVDLGQYPLPERDVAVAEVGEPAAEQEPHKPEQALVAEPAQGSHVLGPRALGEAALAKIAARGGTRRVRRQE